MKSRRFAAGLLCLLMLVSLLPVSAFAACTVTYRVENGTWADGTTEDRIEAVESGSSPADIPTGMLASPGCTGGGWDPDPAGAAITRATMFTYRFDAVNGLINGIPPKDGKYVLMGEENQVSWHIIGEDSSRYLLISASGLNGTLTWDGAKSFCETVFSWLAAPEQAAVLSTTKKDAAYDRYEAADLNNAKLFLLSASEALVYFSSDDARLPGRWWLRSSWPYGYGGIVDRNGGLYHSGDTDDRHNRARPAFQLDRQSVLLESAAEGGKCSAAAGSGAFGTVSGAGSSEIRLTLIDSRRSGFSANVAGANSAVAAPGGTLTVTYSGAGTGENEYVSAALCSPSGPALYYASLTPDSSGSGTWDMTIPSELAGDSYILKVFSEQQNGDRKTDFASPPAEIRLTAGSAAPAVHTVTYKVVNGAWADGTTEDRTEEMEDGFSPAAVPTGMQPASGFAGGAWDADPAGAVITGETTFTFTFEDFDSFGLINEIPASDGNHVWMGGDDPVKWHIIGANTSNWLLTASDLFGGGYNPISWYDAMDSVGTVLSGFTAAEKSQTVIPVTSKSEPVDYQYEDIQFGRSEVSSQVFLLSAQEAETYFDSDNARLPGKWWLRSPVCDSQSAGCINEYGSVQSLPADRWNLYGIRPAFQLDRSSVLFASAAEGSKSSADAGSGEFGTITGPSGADRNEVRLTLNIGARSGFSANAAGASSAAVDPGGTLAVTYSGASTGTNEFVSALLCETSGAILYYASMTPEKSGSGTWNLAMPESIAGGSFILKVFSEQQNGDKRTDYASEPCEIELMIGDPAAAYPVTYKVVNGTWADGTTEDKTEIVEIGSSPAAVPTGMLASPGYLGGGWDADPAGAAITWAKTFTYSFDLDDNLINGIPPKDGKYVLMGEENQVSWHIIGEDSSRYLLISASGLNGTLTWDGAKSFCETVFSWLAAPEQAAVLSTTKKDAAYDRYEAADLNNAKLFLLSASEALVYFSSDDARLPGRWWLRSSWPYGYGGIVDRNGGLYHSGDTDDRHNRARPAFQLDRQSVLLESAAEGGKCSAAAGSGAFGTVSGAGSSEIRLTLIDSRRSGFSANVAGANSAVAAPGGTLTVTYSGAGTGENEYVSAALCSPSGPALYYASLTPDSSGSGTWDMTIPSELAGDSYILKVFSEQQNGDRKTDFASDPAEIELTAAEPAPAFRSHSLVLSGQIGVNFYLDLSMLTEAEREASSMEFTVNGKTKTDTFDADFTNPSTGEYYGFTCPINSVEMADGITAVFRYTRNGEAKTVSQTYFAKDYVEYVLSHTDEYSANAVALVEAIADYGHYVQPFLADANHWALGTDHAVMPNANTYSEADVSAARDAVENCVILRDPGDSRIEAVTYSLNLETETAIRIYLRVQDGYKGAVTAALGETPVNCVRQKDGRYRIELGGIPAHRLGDAYELTVSAGGEFPISVSALSYVNTVLNSESEAFDNDTAHWAVTSLYNYYAAAEAYLAGPDQ